MAHRKGSRGGLQSQPEGSRGGKSGGPTAGMRLGGKPATRKAGTRSIHGKLPSGPGGRRGGSR